MSTDQDGTVTPVIVCEEVVDAAVVRREQTKAARAASRASRMAAAEARAARMLIERGWSVTPPEQRG